MLIRVQAWVRYKPADMVSVFVVALSLLAAPPAVPSSRTGRYELGQKLFAQGEIDAALKTLDAAAQETIDLPQLEKIHLLRAQCFAARQDFGKAEEAFTQALEANPDTSLDPARVDPVVVKLLESVRARLTSAVSVNSTPAGAMVFLDGKQAGAAPLTLTTPVGKHRLEARFGDGPMNGIDVTVKARRELRIEWVQPVAAADSVGGNAKVSERPITPFGDVRGTLEISANQAPVRGGLDVGGGFEVRWFRMGLWARVFPYFGVAPRFAFFVPVIDRVNVFLEAWVPVWFRNGGIALGLGAAGGAEYAFKKWLGAFLQIGGEHLFLNPNANDDTHFIATAGARLRLP